MTIPAQTVALRHAGTDDADAIAQLHTESWRRTYRGMMSDDFLDHRALDNRRLTWRERLEAPPPNQYVRVAGDQTAIVGFICGFADHDPVWGSYIDNLHVTAGMHRQGIGRALMRDVAGWLCQVRPDRGVWLWVMEANTSARAFYDRLGATNAGTANLRDPDGGHAPNCRYVWPRPSVLVTQ